MTETVLHVAEAVTEYLAEPNRTHLLDVMLSYDSVERANEGLRRLTGVRAFFQGRRGFDDFRGVLAHSAPPPNGQSDRKWGDFQTPPSLASRVCRYLTTAGVSPHVIVEPTYGTGNFIVAALRSFPSTRLVYGVEMQEKYEWRLKAALLTEALRGRHWSAEIELHQDNIFTHRFADDLAHAQDILVLGNPPWVTSAELGALGGGNLPAKANINGLSGMDALTGKSNFDIGEFILLRMLELFSGRRGTLAMLCKNSVIKNIVQSLAHRRFRVSNVRALAIDAPLEFGASVSASLLVLEMGVSKPGCSCRVASLAKPNRVTRTFGWAEGKFVSNVEDYEQARELDDESPLVWRQGVKHDCAKVMELAKVAGAWVNGKGEVVNVEDEWVFWLLKSSDVGSFEVSRARKKVIITQRHIGEDTSLIRRNAPKLWKYLAANAKSLQGRKSRIYRGRPPFSIFGIGEYSFKPYKVAISGLYKQPRFSLVLPIENRPVMLDDTCYFLGLDTYLQTLLTASLLNSPPVQSLLSSISFHEAKRPYTKQVLTRIDLCRAVRRLSFKTLGAFWAEIGYTPSISVAESDFEEYKNWLSTASKDQKDSQLKLEL